MQGLIQYVLAICRHNLDKQGKVLLHCSFLDEICVYRGTCRLFHLQLSPCDRNSRGPHGKRSTADDLCDSHQLAVRPLEAVRAYIRRPAYPSFGPDKSESSLDYAAAK